MTQKVEELAARNARLMRRHAAENDIARRECRICNPKEDEVPAWKVWRWSLAHPNESPFRR